MRFPSEALEETAVPQFEEIEKVENKTRGGFGSTDQ